MRFLKLKIDRFILGGTSYNPKPSLKDYMKLNLINYPKYFRARFVKIFIPFSIVFSGTKNFELCKGYLTFSSSPAPSQAKLPFISFKYSSIIE